MKMFSDVFGLAQRHLDSAMKLPKLAPFNPKAQFG